MVAATCPRRRRVCKKALVLSAYQFQDANTDVLSHLAGHLKTALDGEDKAELREVIDQYRRGLVPLIVPATLLRHHFRRHPSDWVAQQTFLEPYPAELMLRNHV